VRTIRVSNRAEYLATPPKPRQDRHMTSLRGAVRADGPSQDRSDEARGPDAPGGDDGRNERVLVVTPDGMAVAGETEGDANPATLVEQPAKVMRIGSMIKQLLEEVHNAPLDDAGRARLAGIHERSIEELKKGLAPELVDELNAIALPFDDTSTPSDAELRVAQAQLVGWLEGLFHGIQTALFAQQMAARAQLEHMRRALPPGLSPGPGDHGPPARGQGPDGGTGQYL
jgi:Bacterial proteasome activator